jgi:hypothetical protein
MAGLSGKRARARTRAFYGVARMAGFQGEKEGSSIHLADLLRRD